MQAISSRVIYIILNISKRYSLQIIQVYAPTSTADDDEIVQLYEDIVLAKNSEKAKYCMIIGDFNAKVGNKNDHSMTSVGKFGVGIRNPRGDTLIDFMENEHLFCMNTFFKKPVHRKWTWRSADGKTKNEIDFILSNDKGIIKDVSVLNRFHTGSDHRLIRAKVWFNIKAERRKLFRPLPYPTLEELKSSELLFQKELDSKIKPEQLGNLDLNELTQKITEDIKSATKKIIMRAKQRDRRITPNTLKLMEQRRTTSRDSPEYRQLNKDVSKNIRKDIRTHNTAKIVELIEDNMNMRVLRSKMTTGRVRINKIKNRLGVVETDRNKILEVIETFYTDLYTSTNQNSVVTNKVVTNVGSEIIPDIDMCEITTALKQMKNRKSPGEDRISCEMLKMGGANLMSAVQILYNKCLSEERIPDAWQSAEVILLFKKGDSTNIENYRPISLLTHLYKLFTKIITNRLTKKLDFYQPNEQAGFRKGFSTIDHLQALRTLIEKTTEYNIPIHLAFVDYQKAFDSIEKWSVIQALNNARIDSRYTNLLKSIYDKANFYVKLDENTKTDKISIHKGVRQGDTISPKLFTLAMEDIFKTLPWDNKGINVDGVYLNNLRFADDVVLISDNLGDLESMLCQLSEASYRVGLKMNLSKTKIISPDIRQINIQNQPLENVNEYIYLGHAIQLGKNNQTAEISRRVRLSWAAFGKLGFVLKNPEVPINLKAKVYNTCILPVATYGLETMSLTVKCMNKLKTTQRAMERTMLGVSLRDKMRNDDIRKKTNIFDIEERVATLKWNWVGHVAREDTNRWTNKIVHWRPRISKRSVGRPQKRWLDDIKKAAGRYWYQLAKDKEVWKKRGEAYVQEWTKFQG